MKYLLKLFFTVTVIFLTSVSFAGNREKKIELTTSVLQPIVNQLGGDGSVSKLIHLELIKRQVANGKQKNFDLAGVVAVQQDMCKKGYNNIFENFCTQLKKANEIGQHKHGDTPDMAVTKLTQSMLSVWNGKIANAADYAKFTLLAFEFNQMNNKKPGVESEVFKRSVIVRTLDNGDHAMVLVEDENDTIFVVDPWMRHVRIVETFPSLDKIRSHAREVYRQTYPRDHNLFDKEKVYPIPEDTPNYGADPNVVLNKLYRDKHTNYYDGYYVRADTIWVLDEANSEKIRNAVHHPSADMKVLYNTLRPSFPQWVKEYEDLFTDQVKNPTMLDYKKPGPNDKQITVSGDELPGTEKPSVTHHTSGLENSEGKK